MELTFLVRWCVVSGALGNLGPGGGVNLFLCGCCVILQVFDCVCLGLIFGKKSSSAIIQLNYQEDCGVCVVARKSLHS